MSDRAFAQVQAQQKTLSRSTPKSSLLQRTCACGQHTIAGGECSTCRNEQSILSRSQRAFEPLSAPGTLPSSSLDDPSFNSAFDRASHFGHDFSQIPIHSSATGVIQTKLAINQPGDHYEQEADHISQQVMRMPEPQLQRACTCGGACPECKTEQPDQEHERLQTKRVQASDTGSVVAPPIVNAVLRSPGQPLDPATRAFMEPRFGHDFSRVRVHSDAVAEQSARDVNANAYTVGHDIVFGAGRFAPGTHEGRQLLAHELTHVAQQRSCAGPPLQRQPTPDVNKSAKFIEDTYRSGARQLDDPTLSEAASDVRRCRREGGYYCEILVTDDDINSMYAEWSLIESVYDRETANKAISDHKLREVAQRAAGVKKQETAAQDKATQSGVTVGGLTALAPSTVPAPTGPMTLPSVSPANTNIPLEAPKPLPSASPANTNIPLEAPKPLPSASPANTNIPLEAPKPKPLPVAAVGVAIAVVFGIVVTVQLALLAQFQEKLFAAGYKYLPSPRGVCQRGCHQGSQNLPHTFDFPKPVFPGRSTPLTPLFPRAGPRPQPSPKPQPEPDEKEKEENTCANTFPNLILCGDLPMNYQFANGYQDARRKFPRGTGFEDPPKVVDNPRIPCYGKGGTHRLITDSDGDFLGSLVCCPCCHPPPVGPVELERCAYRAMEEKGSDRFYKQNP
jgi:hypothetical protein